MDWWLDLLWYLGTTSNCNATANLNTLQITTANTKSSPARSVFNSRFLVTDVNSEDSSASSVQVLPVLQISRNSTLSIPLSWPGVLVIQPRCGFNRKHRFQQFFSCCYGRLPSDISDIVDVFTGSYQATHAPSRDRCIATVIHVTIFWVTSSVVKQAISE
jgi:hypothetical protein